jgi:hypothetical protein
MKDESYIESYLKQAIELNEKAENPAVNSRDLDALLSGKRQDDELL